MTTFLDRVVSKALAGPDDRTAMRPRIDPITAISNATVNASMAGDIGEDTRAERETEPGRTQTVRIDLTRSVVTPETQGRAVSRRVPQTGREKKAQESIGAEARTRSVHPVQPSSVHSVMPTAIQPEESTPVPGPELPTADVLREPMFLPIRHHTTRAKQAFVLPRAPVPTGPGDSEAAPESDGRTTPGDVPQETDKAEVPAIGSLLSSEYQQRSHIVPRVSFDRGALHDVVVPIAIPSRRVLAHLVRTRDTNHDETTVHVTIGRLEIRAPQSLPAAAPRRTQTTREGHLEDYLKKRASRGTR